MCKKKCNIIVMSPGSQSGKSKLISEITKSEYRDIKAFYMERACYLFEYNNNKDEIFIYGMYLFEYNNNKDEIFIYDTPTSERIFNFSFNFFKRMDIIIYMVDIQEQHLIDESMIDRIYDIKKSILFML